MEETNDRLLTKFRAGNFINKLSIFNYSLQQLRIPNPISKMKGLYSAAAHKREPETGSASRHASTIDHSFTYSKANILVIYQNEGTLSIIYTITNVSNSRISKSTVNNYFNKVSISKDRWNILLWIWFLFRDFLYTWSHQPGL